MTSNVTNEHSRIINHFGFSCPKGGRFYICENGEEEFMGCCASDPCAKGKGVCPNKDLYVATFSRDTYAELPMQDCRIAGGSKSFYACAFIDPPFIGCCDQNACASGCPRASLVPMVLSEDSVNRYSLIYPGSLGEGLNATTVSIPRPSLTSALESSKDQGSDQNQAKHSMGAGAVAGICLAAVVAVLLLLGAFWRYW